MVVAMCIERKNIYIKRKYDCLKPQINPKQIGMIRGFIIEQSITYNVKLKT